MDEKDDGEIGRQGGEGRKEESKEERRGVEREREREGGEGMVLGVFIQTEERERMAQAERERECCTWGWR